ncbi:hypothetical protein [Bradyrhizobium sp. AS23.2]|uniref:hypothetical protein n=1 Tax=Bradyrhizobium sp. AS23.2 TaxID=1680155 RepID=UPI0009401F85|nr:hypothetical protein [Bradyrhizobium sp. AS23.2]OKO79826.1 hypothetical protein AC630_16810 [Bradyrhizobium sp. AS23.2]
MIAGQGEAYIGASNRALKCVAEHAEGPAKAFAAEAFLLHEQEPHTLEWSARPYLEHRLTGLAKEAGLVNWPTRWSRGFCLGLSNRSQRWNGWWRMAAACCSTRVAGFSTQTSRASFLREPQSMPRSTCRWHTRPKAAC